MLISLWSVLYITKHVYLPSSMMDTLCKEIDAFPFLADSSLNMILESLLTTFLSYFKISFSWAYQNTAREFGSTGELDTKKVQVRRTLDPRDARWREGPNMFKAGANEILK